MPGPQVKTKKELAVMREGGRILSQILAKVVKQVAPGVGTEELDDLAEQLMIEAGATPAFKGYKTPYAPRSFPTTLCTSINAEVVHAPASPSRILQAGSILSLDIGMRYPAEGGLYTDMAVTVPVGKVGKEEKRLMAATRESLQAGIAAVKRGATLADIGRAVQAHVESRGFGIVRELVGHGVGYAVHEDPQVPNYYDPQLKNSVIPLNLPLAIEPMVTAGDWRVTTGDDGWTIGTVDGSWAAHFEATVVLGEQGVEILTPLPL